MRAMMLAYMSASNLQAYKEGQEAQANNEKVGKAVIQVIVPVEDILEVREINGPTVVFRIQKWDGRMGET